MHGLHVYIHYVRIYYGCILLPKPSLRPPLFCRFLFFSLERSSDLARPQLQRFPPPRCPPAFPAKKLARYPSRSRANPRIVGSFTAHDVAMPPIARFSPIGLPLFFFSLSLFFLSSRPRIVGRRTRVVGQGSKTWKGYRNSLFPPFLSSFLSFVAISLFSLPLSFSLSLLLSPPSGKKAIDLNVRDGR